LSAFAELNISLDIADLGDAATPAKSGVEIKKTQRPKTSP